MTTTIRRIATRGIRVPLSRPWGPDVRDLSLVEVVVEDSAGDLGHGFSWTPQIGAAAVQAHLDHDIASFALGENLYTRYRFAEFIDAGAVDLVQPNVVRVGGITPFRSIAALAEERGVDLAPHLLLELSAQLALTLPGLHLVESVEDASFADLGVLAATSPIAVEGNTARTTGQTGLGIRFIDDRADAAASADHTEES